jgi:hypothetical protein
VVGVVAGPIGLVTEVFVLSNFLVLLSLLQYKMTPNLPSWELLSSQKLKNVWVPAILFLQVIGMALKFLKELMFLQELLFSKELAVVLEMAILFLLTLN